MTVLREKLACGWPDDSIIQFHAYGYLARGIEAEGGDAWRLRSREPVPAWARLARSLGSMRRGTLVSAEHSIGVDETQPIGPAERFSCARDGSIGVRPRPIALQLKQVLQ